MGGTSSQTSNQSQQSTTAPWAPSQGFLQGILNGLNTLSPQAGLNPTQASAIGATEANAGNYGQFSPMISDVVKSYLGGGGATDQAGSVQGNLDAYKAALTPFANGSMIGQNVGLQPDLDSIRNDVTNQVNGQFAAAGRDFSPANSQALARGIAQGEAPVIQSQYNTDINNQRSAIDALYNGGNATSGILTGLNQATLQNRGSGVGLVPQAVSSSNAGPAAILQAEAQRLGIPVGNLGMLSQIGVPIAGLGSQSQGTGTSNTTSQMSGAQQFLNIMQGIGALGNLWGGRK